MVASTVSTEEAGNQTYQTGHMGLIFGQGFSFSGYERNGVFLNRQGKTYRNISGISGADSILDGRAATLADFDNDGDMDLFVTTIQDDAHLLYRNNLGSKQGHIRVTLKGTESGTDAFGTIVKLKTSHGIQTQVSGGGGFISQNDRRLLFGLGADTQADWLEVTWPSGKVQRFDSLKRGASVLVVEGKDEVQPVDEKAFRLADPIDRDSDWRQLTFKKGAHFPEVSISAVGDGLALAGQTLPKGKSYFLNLWATWCGPCRKEMPELERLKAEFEAKGIQLVGLSVDQDMPLDEIESFARGMGVSYSLGHLAESEFSKLFSGAQLTVPFSILIDQDGKVIDVFSGWNPETEHRLLAWLAKATFK